MQTQSSGGIGFGGLLTIVFIVLKLTHVIHWSWLWVLAPLWISFGLFLVVMAIVIIIALFTVRRHGKRGRASAWW